MSDAASTQELREAATRGVRWISLARVTIEIVLLGSMVVVARLVPPADFGYFAVALIVSELALAVPGEGVGSALVQRNAVSRQHLQAGAFLAVAGAVVMSAVTLLAAPTLVSPVFGEQTASFVELMTPMFLIAAFGGVPMAILRRRLDFRRLSVIDITAAATRATVSVALAIAGLNGEALVLGVIAGALAGTILALCSAPLVVPWPRRAAIRDISGYGTPASLAALSWVGFRNCDYAIVSARLGALSAGFYFRAYTLAVEYQRKLSVVMFQVAFPVLSRTASLDELHTLQARMVRLLAVILFPCQALLAILAPILVPAVFGQAWAPAVVPTQILCAAGAASLVIDAAGPALMAAGRARALLGYGVAHFTTYAAVVFFAAPFGLSAVAAGAAVVHTLFLLVAYVVLLRGTSEPPLRRLWTDVSAALVSCAGLAAAAVPVSWVLTASDAPGVVRLLGVALVGVAAYLLTLRACFADRWRELRALIRAIVPTHPRRGPRSPLPVSQTGSAA